MVFSGLPSFVALLRSSPVRSITSIYQHSSSAVSTSAADVLKHGDRLQGNHLLWHDAGQAPQRSSCSSGVHTAVFGAGCEIGTLEETTGSGYSVVVDCENDSSLLASGGHGICVDVEVERLRETCQVLFCSPHSSSVMASNGKRTFTLSAGLHASGIDNSMKSGYTAESSCETNTNLVGNQIRQRSTSARQFLTSCNSSIEYTTYLGWHTLSSDLSEKLRQGSIRVNRHNTLEYATIDEERGHGDKVPLLRRVQTSGSTQGNYSKKRTYTAFYFVTRCPEIIYQLERYRILFVAQRTRCYKPI